MSWIQRSNEQWTHRTVDGWQILKLSYPPKEARYQVLGPDYGPFKHPTLEAAIAAADAEIENRSGVS